MSACESLRLRAAFLAALPADDQERRELDQHARSCAGCALALREGQQLFRLLGAAPLAAPSPQALRRAASPLLRELRNGQN